MVSVSKTLNTIFIGMGILVSNVCLAQNPSAASSSICYESRASEYIENSDLKILFRNGGDMFWDGQSTSQFIVPYDQGQPETTTMFAAATWMGGYDPGGNLALAAQTYRSNGNDYWAGPLDANGQVVQNACTLFDKIWEVKRWAIESHKADFDADGVINNQPDASILQWPAKGNPQFTAFALPNQDLAPFYDRNNNGIYEPMLGDYPVFKHGDPTAIAEEILWSVFNDNGNIHTQTNSQSMKVEIQQTAYVFECPNDLVLNRSLFIKHKVINKSGNFYTGYSYGVWGDPDLGCSNDDFMGTIPSKNTIYAYNADNDDDVMCGANGGRGYGTNPPVQSLTLLNQVMSSSAYTVNSNSPVGDPTSALSYYRVLSGFWPNGTVITAGGNGYNPGGSGAATNHVFPDNPNDPNGWSMYAEGLTGLDQRWIVSVQKDTLHAGEALEIDMVYTYHRDLDSTHLGNVNLMYQQVDYIQQLYDNNFSTINCNTPAYCTANCIFPGDANDNGIANDFDILAMALYQTQTVAPRATITDNWSPQNPPVPLTNGYADANGDGTINVVDMDVNTSNFHKLHAYTGAPEGTNNVGTDLTFNRVYTLNPVLPPLDTLISFGKLVYLDVELGTPSTPINDLLGITFRVDYNPDVFDFVPGASNNTYNGGLDGGWLGDDGAPLFTRTINEQGRLHHVTTRLNQTAYSGGGNIGRIVFRVKWGAPINLNTVVNEVCFSDIRAVRTNGTEILLGSDCELLAFLDSAGFNVPINKIEDAPLQVEVYPNPAQTELTIDLGSLEGASVELHTLLGEERYKAENQQGLLTINRNDLPSGVYLVVIRAADGRLATRKIIFE